MVILENIISDLLRRIKCQFFQVAGGKKCHFNLQVRKRENSARVQDPQTEKTSNLKTILQKSEFDIFKKFPILDHSAKKFAKFKTSKNFPR